MYFLIGLWKVYNNNDKDYIRVSTNEEEVSKNNTALKDIKKRYNKTNYIMIFSIGDDKRSF